MDSPPMIRHHRLMDGCVVDEVVAKLNLLEGVFTSFFA